MIIRWLMWRRKMSQVGVASLLRRHFHPIRLDALSISERTFPFRVRADLQRALDRLLAGDVKVVRFCGVRKEYCHEGLDFPALITEEHSPAVVVPPEYEQIDIGEEQPLPCLRAGLWLLESPRSRYAVLLCPASHYGQVTGVKFQVATTANDEGARITQEFLRQLEEAVLQARSYRGKILSLEESPHFHGQSTGLKVHKLRTVSREQVILPKSTLELLERNVIQFVRQRSRLAEMRQSTRKGVLFYGPPGTGKTHTIHFLAGALPGHTTLLISAEQVGLLAEYMALARLLQPSVVVIEDVDLIARDREQMHNPCGEALLNRLLNEMDGLKEDADILFILTTNRPEALERALTSRPGRVDQAIEFPLPDDEGREKLIRLYSQGVNVPDDVIREVARRTQQVSAAFIKELMRRSVQFHLESDGTGVISLADVERALAEMLFVGGSLNRKLLGVHSEPVAD